MAMFPSADEPTSGSSGIAPLQPTLDWLQARSQIDFDIDFFGAILDRAPRFIDVLRCQGELLTRKGLHEQALKIDRELARLLPDDSIVRYNLACSLAMMEEPHEALVELRAAFERGFCDVGHLGMDSDLDSLRDLLEYQELLNEYGLDG